MPGGCTGQWDKIDGPAAFDATANTAMADVHIVDISNTTKTQFSWTVRSLANPKCTNTAYVKLVSNKVVASIKSDNPLYICWDDKNEVEIKADNISDGTAYWEPTSITNTGIIEDSKEPTTRIYDIEPRAIETYRWHVSKGTGANACNDYADLTIINHNYSLSAGNYDYNNCGPVIHLNADHPTGGAGRWEIVSGQSNCSIVNSTLYNTDLKINPGAKVSVRWVYNLNEGDNCPDNADTAIIVSHAVAPHAEPDVFCKPEGVLNADAPVVDNGETGWWVAPAGVTFENNNSTLYNVKVYGLQEGGNNTFEWHIDNGYCHDHTTVSYTYLVPNSRITGPAVLPDMCDDDYTLTAAFNPANHADYTGEWKIVKGGPDTYINNSTNYTTRIYNLQPGENIVQWTVTNKNYGCFSTSSIQYFNMGVTLANIDDVKECNSYGNLSGNGPTSQNGWVGRWSVHPNFVNAANRAGFTISSPDQMNTKYTNLPTGSIMVRWTVVDPASGCKDSVDVAIYNNLFNPTVNTDGVDKCSAEVTIAGTMYDRDKDQGWWETPDQSPLVVSSPSSAITKVSHLMYGDNAIRWYVNHNECISHIDVSIPHAMFSNFTAGIDDETCDEVYTLYATDPYSVQGVDPTKITSRWECVTGNAEFTNPTAFNSGVKKLNFGPNKLQWIVGNEECPAMVADVIITSNRQTAIGGGADTYLPICSNDFAFVAEMPAQYDSVWWSVGSGSGTFDEFNYKTINQNVVFDPVNSNMSAADKAYWSTKTAADFYAYASSYAADCNQTKVTNMAKLNNEYYWNVAYKGCVVQDLVKLRNIKPSARANSHSSHICSSETTLIAGRPSMGTGVWTKLSPNTDESVIENSSYFMTKVTNIGTGDHTYIWTVTNVDSGIECKDDFEITVTNEQISTFAGVDHAVCDGNNVRLQAMDPSTLGDFIGTWHGPTTAVVFDNSTSFTTTVSGLAAGPNRLRWEVISKDPNNDCHAEAEVIITNNKPTQPNLGPDYFSCDDEADLQGTSPASGEIGYWFNVNENGIIAQTTAVYTHVTGLADGDNKFAWFIQRGTGDNACTLSDTVNIRNRHLLVNVASSKEEYCSDTAYVEGSVYGGTNIYYTSVWTAESGGASFLANSTLAKATAVGLGSGKNMLKWTVTVPATNGYGDCTVEKMINVWNMTPEKANIIESSMSVCTNEAELTANQPSIAGERGEWSVLQGSGSWDNSTNYKTTVRDLNFDHNYITWTIRRGNCLSIDTIDVIANNIVTSVTGDNGTNVRQICQIDKPELSISATPLKNGGTGYWFPSSNNIQFIDESTLATTRIKVLAPGRHKLVWYMKENNCDANAELYVDALQSTATAYMNDENPVCDGQAVLSALQPDVPSAVGYWFTPNKTTAHFSNSLNNISTLYMSQRGQFTASWIVETPRLHGLDACRSQADVIVYNYQVDPGPDFEINACSYDDVKNLVAVEPYPGDYGEWHIANGTGCEIVNSTTFETQVKHINKGATTLYWVVKTPEWFDDVNDPNHLNPKVCSDSSSVQVYNNAFDISAGKSIQVCGPETPLEGRLPNNSNITCEWSGGNFLDPTDPATTVFNLRKSVPTELTLKAYSNGCEAEAKVVVTNVQVDIEIPTGSKTVCSDDIQLEAKMSAGTGVWSIPNGIGTFDDETNNVTMVRGLGKGDNVITWTVTNGDINCRSSESITLNNQTLHVSAGSDQYVCDTFAYLAGDALAPNQIGEWRLGSLSTATVPFSGAGPVFVDNTQNNTTVYGLYFNDEGLGYANAFFWHVKDTVTRCEGEASVKILSYHFEVDADTSTISNSHIARPGHDHYTIGGTPQKTNSNSDPLYSVEWRPLEGSGRPTPRNDFVTEFKGLSSGRNTFEYIVTLNRYQIEGAQAGILNPDCKAKSYVVINYQAFKVEAGDDVPTCVDSVKLNAQQPEGAVGHWTSRERGCEFDDATDPKTWVRKLKPGRNVLYWNVTRNGFTAIDSVVISNYGFTVDAGYDQHLCVDSTVLKATGPLNNPLITNNWYGYWDTPQGSATYEYPSAQETKVKDLDVNTNIIVWHVEAWGPQQNCFATDTVRVSYYVAPDAEFTIVPKTAAGCSPFTAQFANTTIDTDSTGSTFYTWNFGNITSIETTDHDNLIERTFYNTSDHDSTLQIWLTTGIKIPGNQTCYNVDSSEITVFTVPTAKFTVSPARQMQPSTQFSLYAVQNEGNEVRYAWAYGDGQGTVWNDNTEFEKTLTHKYMNFGEYKIVLDVKNKFCAASDTQVVIIDPAPPKRTMQSTGFEGCEPYLHELIEEVLYADSVRWDIYQVSDSLVLQAQMMVPDQKLATYLFNKPGRYLLYQYAFGPGTDGELYMRTDTVTVFSTPIVDYKAYPDTVRLPNQALYTSNESINGATYLWDFGDGQTSVEKEPTHYYTEAGDFYISLKVTSAEGCTTVGNEQHVRVEPEGMLRFPNAFKPNPAGPSGGVPTRTKNYVFIPYPRNGIKAGTYKLQIFNRYGEKIFESTDPEIGWDGYYRGDLCAQDVYVWKCNCIFENGKIYKKIGNVTLLR